MSRHLFFTQHQGEFVAILMGWDVTQQGYFMQVTKPDSDKIKVLYSHLTFKEMYPKTLKPYIEVLNRYRIQLPLPMVEEVAEDGAQNIGTKDVTHYVIEGQYQRKLGIDEALLQDFTP